MVTDNLVQLERHGAVATLWLNRPEVLNALDDPMKAAVAGGIRQLDQEPDIHVIILRGRGRAFCSGADLKGFGDFADVTTDRLHSSLALGKAMIDAIMEARAIVVSLIHGYCVGGGVSIALASDLAIATSDATFFIPEVDLGLPYLWGSTALFLAASGVKRANYYTLTCDRFNAGQALEMGVVHQLCETRDLEKAAAALVDKLAAKPVAGLVAQKKLMNRLLRHLMAQTGDETSMGIDCIQHAFPHIR